MNIIAFKISIEIQSSQVEYNYTIRPQIVDFIIITIVFIEFFASNQNFTLKLYSSHAHDIAVSVTEVGRYQPEIKAHDIDSLGFDWLGRLLLNVATRSPDVFSRSFTITVRVYT